MIWFFRAVFWLPLVFTGLTLLWLFYLELKRKVSVRTARRALLLVILVELLSLVAKLAYIYITLSRDEFGKFLLPPNSDYFYRTVWLMSSSYVYSLAIAIALILVLLLFKRILRNQIVDATDLYILFLSIFAVGAQSVVVLILASFFLMIFFITGYSFKKKKAVKEARLVIAPFFLVSAFVLLILANLPSDRQGFDFYIKFLQFLHLT